jgi:tripeptidyl-peptidase I
MLLAPLLLAVAVIAAPASHLVLHEERSAPEHLVRRRLDADTVLPVRIALTQSKLDEGYAYLMVTSPKSCQYYLSNSDQTTHAQGCF